MESHNGMSSSGSLYGFGLLFADFAELELINELDEELSADESATISVDELLTAGVIRGSLDDERRTHIVASEELDSGTYRSI